LLSGIIIASFAISSGSNLCFSLIGLVGIAAILGAIFCFEFGNTFIQ